MNTRKPITINFITARAIMYQLIGYGILLFLVTGDEVFDFPHNIFGFPATPINWGEVIIESSYIIVLCAFTVYLTYRFLREIKLLEGIIPICSHCKKILDKEDWKSLEEYLSNKSEALLSHGVCPECAKKYYGDFFNNRKND